MDEDKDSSRKNTYQVQFYDEKGERLDYQWFQTRAEAFAFCGHRLAESAEVRFANLETGYRETWKRAVENAPRFVQLGVFEPDKKYVVSYRSVGGHWLVARGGLTGPEAIAFCLKSDSERQIHAGYPHERELIATYLRPLPE